MLNLISSASPLVFWSIIGAILVSIGFIGYLSNSILRDIGFGAIGNGIIVFLGCVAGFGARILFEKLV